MEVGLAKQTSGTATGMRSLTANSDFETFLRMLTTQVQNQDPLSPMETNEFANQLAAFTMVEQQTLTNQNFQELLSIVEKNCVSNYASMVGKTTVHESPFFFSGQPMDFEISGLTSNDAVKLVVTDTSGNIVSQQAVDMDSEIVVWQGRDQDGLMLGAGTYLAQLRSIENDNVLDGKVGLVSTIEEVRFDPSGVMLLMTNGSLVSEDAVLKLRS